MGRKVLDELDALVKLDLRWYPILGEHTDGVWMERFDVARHDRIVGQVAHLLDVAAHQGIDSYGEKNVKMMLRCARRLRATLS